LSLTDAIKDYALSLGYHAVGVAPAEPFAQFAAALEQRRADYGPFPHLWPAADPRNVMPEAKSLVVCIYDYSREGFPPELVGRVARFYLSRAYRPLPDNPHFFRLQLLRQFLENAGCRIAPWPGGLSGVPDRQAAARAGVAQFGRNNFACSPGAGTFIIINTFVVDKELAYDRPSEGLHCPPKCRLCREACPTGALVEDLRLDPRLCVAFNTFTTRGEETGVSPYIAAEIRPKMGGWVHGCDICQEVCPKNVARVKARLPVSAYLSKKAAEFDLYSLLHMTDEYYARVVHPLMYHYIRDQKFFRRNAAVALGNSGDPAAVPHLVQALDDPEEVVRAHVAWALGRLGGRAATEALEKHLARETGEEARREIREALAAM